MSKMKTPDEAKELVCPFLQGFSCQMVDGELTKIFPSYQQNCTADKCMAWQWADGTKVRQTISDMPKDYKTGNEGKGYCSLTSVRD